MNQGLVFHWISLKPKSVIRVYDKLVFVPRCGGFAIRHNRL